MRIWHSGWQTPSIRKDDDSEWEHVENLPREYLGHEFCKVREDEKEESVSIYAWITDITTAELE